MDDYEWFTSAIISAVSLLLIKDYQNGMLDNAGFLFIWGISVIVLLFIFGVLKPKVEISIRSWDLDSLKKTVTDIDTYQLGQIDANKCTCTIDGVDSRIYWTNERAKLVQKIDELEDTPIRISNHRQVSFWIFMLWIGLTFAVFFIPNYNMHSPNIIEWLMSFIVLPMIGGLLSMTIDSMINTLWI